MTLKSKIEGVLLFKNEPVSYAELSKTLKTDRGTVEEAIAELQEEYKNRGIILVSNDTEVCLGTHPSLSGLIEDIQKEELSKEIGRAGIETLAIVLYKGPVSRREIDYIRGVNSTFILRTLLIRGLIERTDPPASTGEVGRAGSARGYHYNPSLQLLQYLGITKKENLPEYEETIKKLREFQTELDTNNNHNE